MRKLKLKLIKVIVNVFGNIQFFSQPFFCLLWGDSHYKIKGPEMRKVIDELQEGDIIMRRYDRYVSGWFIPGFWTHVGIVASDKTIIHAMTKGVIEEDLMTYLRADHIEVLRISNKKFISNAISKAKDSLGKEYDFLFDSHDDERMYCTELIKVCYPKIFSSMEGKSIPPDEITKVKNLETIHSSKEFRKESSKDGTE
jgi:uncharacterized protein YycO